MITSSSKTFDQDYQVFITQIELKRSIRLLDATTNLIVAVKQQVVLQVIHLPLGQRETKTIRGAHLFTGA